MWPCFLTFLHDFLPFCIISYLFACFLTYLHVFLPFCMISYFFCIFPYLFEWFPTFFACFLTFLYDFLLFCMFSYLFARFLRFVAWFLTFFAFFLISLTDPELSSAPTGYGTATGRDQNGFLTLLFLGFNRTWSDKYIFKKYLTGL